jgi:uncharacterized membrane protein YbhN (UPF0104 family)
LISGLALAVAVAAWLGISQRDVMQQLRRAELWPLLFAAAGSYLLLALQSLRWWMVMRPILPLRYGQAFRAMAVGFFFNVVLPARGGDLLRVQYLGKRTGISRAKLLGTEIVDFTSDKWGWVAAFPVVCLLGRPPGWLFRALAILGGLLLLGAALLVLMASRMWRKGPGGRSSGPAWLNNLRDGFAAQHWKRLLVLETLIAPLPWLWETLIISVAGRSLGLSLSPVEAFAALTAFNLAMVVPSPASLGSFESGGTLALVQLGVDKAPAAAFIFLYHLSQVLPGVALGGFILATEGEVLFGRRRLRRTVP